MFIIILWVLLPIVGVLLLRHLALRALAALHLRAVRKPLCGLLDVMIAEIEDLDTPLLDLSIRFETDAQGLVRCAYAAQFPTNTVAHVSWTFDGERRAYAIFRVVWGWPEDSAPLQFPVDGRTCGRAWFVSRMEKICDLLDRYPEDRLMAHRIARVVRVMGGEPA